MNHRRDGAGTLPKRPGVNGADAKARQRAAGLAEPSVAFPARKPIERLVPARASGPDLPAQRRAPTDHALGTEDRAQGYSNAGPDVFWAVSTS